MCAEGRERTAVTSLAPMRASCTPPLNAPLPPRLADVEFKFAFVRSRLDDGEVNGPQESQLTPCWLSLGGHDSLFLVRRVRHPAGFDDRSRIGVEPLSLMEALTYKDYFHKAHRMQYELSYPAQQESAYSPLAPGLIPRGTAPFCEWTAAEAGGPLPVPFGSMLVEGEKRGGWSSLNRTCCFGLKAAAPVEAGPRAMLDLVFGSTSSRHERPSLASLTLTYLPGNELGHADGYYDGRSTGARDRAPCWETSTEEAMAARTACMQAKLDAQMEEWQAWRAKEKAKAMAEYMQEALAEHNEMNEWQMDAMGADMLPFDYRSVAASFEEEWRFDEDGRAEDALESTFLDGHGDTYGYARSLGRRDTHSERRRSQPGASNAGPGVSPAVPLVRLFPCSPQSPPFEPWCG